MKEQKKENQQLFEAWKTPEVNVIDLNEETKSSGGRGDDFGTFS